MAAISALTARATGPVVVGSHGTFIARALVGYGVPGIDWPFCAAMPMPSVYRLRLDGEHVVVTGPGTGSRPAE